MTLGRPLSGLTNFGRDAKPGEFTSWDPVALEFRDVWAEVRALREQVERLENLVRRLTEGGES